MTKISFILISILFITPFGYSQNCNCKDNFEWVKNTFEQNDAGFEYVLKTKGTQAYDEHNHRIFEKVKSVKSLTECSPILFEWLTFFRSGHISISLNDQTNQANATSETNSPKNWKKYIIKTEDFKKYLDKKKASDYEGIWGIGPYKIGIVKQGDKYVGFVIESGESNWTKGLIKLEINTEGGKANSVVYMRDYSAKKYDDVAVIEKNLLKIAHMNLIREYPEIGDDIKFSNYFKLLKSKSPYLEQLNDRTLYLRVPSFQILQKKSIDSVLTANRDKILKTENLIIDIRNGSGGADSSFQGLLPILYTNPIREIGCEFLSTKLNNQRMLDFINKPEYGADEELKKWAKKAYDELEQNPGKFINPDEKDITITKYDTIYPYPKNVGIIINYNNGSSDEQFLLACKQSKKVKLFGTTTRGVLDISNMYFVPSPCNEFQLGYALSRTMRIPEFTIDEKGIQPDYFIDKSIPEYDWIGYVNDILNAE